MKKLFVSASLLLGVIFNANAQTPDVGFGIKGGYNLSNLTGDVENAESKSGFHLGLFVEIPVAERFSIQPEVLYSAQGAKYETESSLINQRLEYKANYDYINVPVLAKFYATEGLAIEVGPQFGFLVSAKDKLETSGVVDTETETDVKDNLESFDFSIAAGLSYKLPSNLLFGARYNFGLSNMVKDASDDYKVRNGVLQVFVGYKF